MAIDIIKMKSIDNHARITLINNLIDEPPTHIKMNVSQRSVSFERWMFVYAHSVIRCRDGHSERETPCFQRQVGEAH